MERKGSFANCLLLRATTNSVQGDRPGVVGGLLRRGRFRGSINHLHHHHYTTLHISGTTMNEYEVGEAKQHRIQLCRTNSMSTSTSFHYPRLPPAQLCLWRMPL